jgi:hypothetical protein
MGIQTISSDYDSDPVYGESLEPLNPKDCRTEQEVRVLLHKKMDNDEAIVRRELVKVWTKIMEKYARPGAQIPSVEAIRKELLDVGVGAAVSAVVDEHWFVFSWMIEDKIREKVERGLQRFDLAGFVSDVRIAQGDPVMLKHLREEIKHYVLSEEF